jgi:hypothetical protein
MLTFLFVLVTNKAGIRYVSSKPLLCYGTYIARATAHNLNTMAVEHVDRAAADVSRKHECYAHL